MTNELNDTPPAAEVLPYATPTDQPYSADLAQLMKRVSFIPAGVGLFILVVFGCTGFDFLIHWGLLWFVYGGLLTLGLFIGAITMYVMTRVHGERSRPAGDEYRTAAVICLATVPVAIFCIVAGMILANLWNGRDWT